MATNKKVSQPKAENKDYIPYEKMTPREKKIFRQGANMVTYNVEKSIGLRN